MRNGRWAATAWLGVALMGWSCLAVLLLVCGRYQELSDVSGFNRSDDEAVPVVETGSPVGFTPDGSRLLAVFPSGKLLQWDWSTGEIVESGSALGGHGLSVPLPGRQRRVVSADDGNVRIWDETTRAAIAALKPPEGMVAVFLAASPDGERLAVLFEDNELIAAKFGLDDFPGESCELVVFRTDDWTRERSLLKFVGLRGLMNFSPDGRRLALSGYQVENGNRVERIAIFDVTNGIKVRELRPDAVGTHADCYLEFSPDGKHIATGTSYWHWNEDWDDDCWHIRVWDAETGELKWSTARHDRRLWSLEFAPNGEVLACTDVSPGFFDYYGEPDDGTFVDTRPQGPRCLVWSTTEGKLVRSVRPGLDMLENPHTCALVRSPDSLYAAFCTHNGFTLHDIRTGEEVRTLSIKPDGTLGTRASRVRSILHGNSRVLGN